MLLYTLLSNDMICLIIWKWEWFI